MRLSVKALDGYVKIDMVKEIRRAYLKYEILSEADLENLGSALKNKDCKR